MERHGSRLATCVKYPENSIRLWDASTGKLIRTMPGHTNAVMGLAFSPDEKRLASISSDQTARLWDGETGQLIAVLRGHTGRLTSVPFTPTAVVWSRRRMTAPCDSGTHTTGELITVLRGHRDAALSPAYSFDGSRLISSSFDGTVRVWDMDLVERNVGLPRHELRLRRGVSPRRWQVASAGVGWHGAALGPGHGPADGDISQRFRHHFVRGV